MRASKWGKAEQLDTRPRPLKGDWVLVGVDGLGAMLFDDPYDALVMNVLPGSEKGWTATIHWNAPGIGRLEEAARDDLPSFEAAKAWVEQKGQT